MSAGRRLPLARAERIAKAFVAEIAPACVPRYCVIAGSIRRRCETVGDIEIVALPRYAQREISGRQAPLFGAPETESVNLIWEAVERMGPDRVQPVTIKGGQRQPDGNWPSKRLEGSKLFQFWLRNARAKVDLFMPASLETWPVILTIRTGPAEFSRALVMRWTQITRGHFVHGHLMLPTGDMVAVGTERDVFDALKIEWVEPEHRRFARDVWSLGQRRQRDTLPSLPPEEIARRRRASFLGDEVSP